MPDRVVSNTTPLNYLIRIGAVELLPQLFDRVLVPQAVIEELTHPRAPVPVRAWATQPPEWLEVRQIVDPQDALLAEFDPGERQAIALAQEISADLVVIDEREARKEAERRSLTITGTLGI